MKGFKKLETDGVKRSRSIKTKLVIYFSVLIILASAAVGIVSSYRAGQALRDQADNALILISTEEAKLTKSKIETQMKALETIALNEDIRTMDWEVQRPILEKLVDGRSFSDFGVVHLDGNIYNIDGTVEDISGKEYINKALNGENGISDLIIDSNAGEGVLIYAVPIERDGQVVGALVGKGNDNILREIINEIHQGDAGHSYIINGIGNVIAHYDTDKVLNQYNPIIEARNDESQSSVAEAFNKMLEERAGVVNYTFEGANLYAAYAPIEGTDWIFVATANEDAVLRAIPQLQKNILRASIIILVIAIIIILIAGNSLVDPIIKTALHLEEIANFDITRDVEEAYQNKKDEVGAMCRSIQNLAVSLRDIIAKIDLSSEEVLATSEELSATTQQSSVAAEEIAKTAEEIARSAAEQAQHTEDGATKSLQLGEAIEKDIECIKNINNILEDTVKSVREGLNEMETLSQKTEESNTALEEINQVILKASESSNKIGQASDVIATIAEQTNLLALNAAIEAARAGETGKGFVVVSEEIRKLAEQSQSSIVVINDIVRELQSNVQNAVNTMERVYHINKEQVNSVVSSKEKYIAITEAIRNAVEAVEQLNTTSKDMENMKDQILDIMENLSCIAQENSAATEEVTASIEEQTASTEEIASVSESLAELAQDLQLIINKFKI